jgi:hypothetical protein
MRYVSADGKPHDDRTGCSADHTHLLVGTLWHVPSVPGHCAIKRSAGTFQIRRGASLIGIQMSHPVDLIVQ